MISARSRQALKGLAEAWLAWLETTGATFDRWPDVCAAALHQRDHHPHRLAVPADNCQEAITHLAGFRDDLPADYRSVVSDDRRTRKQAIEQARNDWENGDHHANGLAALYLAGGDQYLRQICPAPVQRIVLPTYAWDQGSYWTDVPNPWSVEADSHPTEIALARTELPPDESVDQSDTSPPPPFEPATTPLQVALVAAWSRVLDVDTIGIHDNFFALGGQSLQAALLLVEIQTALGVHIDVMELFNSQTVAQLSDVLEDRYPEHVQRFLSNEALPAVDAGETIARVDRQQPLELSFGQQRFWFLDQLMPGAPIYNTHLTVPLHGDLKQDALQSAFAQLLVRHESLRTIIQTHGGEPRQTILEPTAPPLTTVDLTELTLTQREEETRERSDRQAATSFRLDAFPLFRVSLLQLAENEHVLLLTIHHILVDGVSLAILLRDLLRLYAVEVGATTEPLPALPIQYADYATWQRTALQGRTLAREAEFWETKLAGLPTLELNVEVSRSDAQEPRPGTHRLAIGSELFQRLQQTCRQHRVTPFVLTLAAFKLLLARYSGADDIVVGTPVAGRNRREVADVVGFFVNTLALRTEVSHEVTFRELLGRVGKTYFEALGHQETPFDHLAKKLKPDRDAGRHPIFQVLFNYLQQVELAQDESTGGLSVGRVPTNQPPHGGELDLVLTLAETEDSLDAIIGFNASLFSQATIERTGRHLLRLLEQIVETVDLPLADYQLQNDAERHQLLIEWNQTTTTFSQDACLQTLVEQQVERTPEHVAVRSEQGEVTYEELNRRANQVAWLLVERGVQPDQLVGIYLPRSIDAIVAMLGILKSGAAFLPLDPNLPSNRVAGMLDDADAKLVVTSERYLDQLPSRSQAVALSASRSYPVENPSFRLQPNNLAYCLFTSGSQGRPKGVLIEHRSIVNVVECFSRTYDVGDKDRVLQNTSLSFDVSLNEIFPALCRGATVVVSNDDAQLDAKQLVRLIRDQQITITAATPTVLSRLNREVDCLASLRLVLSGGESLGRSHVDRLLPTTVVTNGYGPTETCIAATCYPLSADDTLEKIPIGKPLDNYRIYIVDRQLAPVSVGCAGELCIAGVGLARGYVNDPQLTAEKFVACPFEVDQRMYRTGDLACRLPDGNLQFLGRIDRQVKLRGLRIELGEIEAALLEQPTVANAVVVEHQRESGERCLVAYVVPLGEADSPLETVAASQASGPVTALDEALRGRLPAYMIPSAVEWLPRLPLTAHGKIDHDRLPPPQFKAIGGEAIVVARNDVERQLVEIWSELLEITSPGVHDNFFRCGGHSLLATQLIARVNQAFDVELPLRATFDNPTIAELAQCVAAAPQHQPGQQAITRRRNATDPPLSAIQQSLWLIDQVTGGSPAYAMHAALRLEGPLDVSSLRQCVDELVRRHEVLRTAFPQVDGAPVQQVSAFAPQDVPLIEVAKDEVEATITQLTRQKIDLQSGPVFRATLLRLAEAEHVLVVCGHHIAFDAWSAGILAREIATTYTAFTCGWRSPLADLPIQYADYATWQVTFLESEPARKSLEFWQQQLQDVLPLAWPETSHQPAQLAVGNRQVQLSPVLAENLKRVCDDQGVTPFMFTLAALQMVLARHTGQTLFAVGTPVSGRSHPETQDLIGCFINPVVIRCDVSGNPTFQVALQRVRQSVLQAFDHQETPFSHVAEATGTSMGPDQSLLQVLFDFQHAPQTHANRIGELQISSVEIPAQVAKFPLTVSVQDHGTGLQLIAEFDTQVVSEATVAGLLAQMQVVLEATVKDLATPMDAFESVSGDQLRQLIEWEGGPIETHDLQCVHQSVATQAAQRPEHAAVICGGQRLSYQELNQRANRLAHYLRKQGVVHGDLVGMLLERTVELPVAILAVFKAGATWVPLDPAYPAERLSLMLDDCRPRAVISESGLADAMLGDAHRTWQRILLDQDAAAIDREPAGELRDDVELDQDAYIVFTSGTTGRPNGTVNHHLGLANVIREDIARFDLRNDDRYLSRCPIGFDLFIQELFRALVSGGTLVLADQTSYCDPAAIVRLMRDQEVTTCSMVPALYKALLEENEITQCRTLRHVFVAGDQLTRDVIDLHRRQLNIPLINYYGPAETTIWITSWQVTEDYPAGRIPIGRPIPNTRLYILDDQRRRVPPGVEGDIYVGGVAVGNGYLNRAQLTRQRYLPDPFNDRPEATMYRTGDRGCWLPDGNVHFLGRRDGQVKIRGVRIELGEIESVLKSDPLVSDAAVDVRRLPAGQQGIVAYVVPASAGDWSVQRLRAALATKLPTAMQPVAHVRVTEIPLSPHGKVDRSQLPDVQQPQSDQDAESAAPRTDTERRLHVLWCELLGIESIGVFDDFFALGGHSLLAARMVSRLQTELAADIPLARFFMAPTIAQLAVELDQASPGNAATTNQANDPVAEVTDKRHASLLHIGPGPGRGRQIFVVHGMGGLATNLVPLGRALSDTCDVHALEGQGLFDDLCPHHDMTAMAKHYVQAIRQQQPYGPYLLAGWSMGGSVAWEMTRQLQSAGQTVERLVLIDAYPLWNVNESIRSSFVAARLLSHLGAEFREIADLPQRRQWPAIMQRVADYEGAGAESLRRLVRTCDAHLTASATFVPEPLEVDVVAFWAKQAWGRMLVSQWRKRARGYIARTVPGDHYSMLDVPHVQQLAAEMLECLALPQIQRKAS